MKLLNLTTFLTVLILTFSGCVGTTPTPSDKPVIDSTLPVVKLTETGVFRDMKAIAFEWKRIQDTRVKGIYVYRKDFTQKTPKYIFIETIQNRFVTHYVDQNVKPESKYGYYFKTYTEKSESSSSRETFVQTLPVLDSVSWIHAVENMPRSTKIIWRPHSNQIVERYILERKTLKETKWTKVDTINGRLSAEYIDGDLKDKFIYKYRIKALTYNDIISKPSKEVEILTKPLPDTIENIKATNTLAKRIKVTWNRANIRDFSHYNIYRADKSDSSYDIVGTSKTTEFIDKIEEDGKNYFYRVSVVDQDRLESQSDKKSSSGRTLSKPKMPSSVNITMLGNSLKVDWKSVDSRVKSFVVVKKVKLSWINTKNDVYESIKGNSFIDKAIAPETTYYYEVYSVDKFGIKSDPSIEVEYTTKKNEGTKTVVKTKNVTPMKNDATTPTEVKNVIKPIENFDVSTL